MIEKDYISFQDLMKRWGASTEEVHHLISEGVLSPCIIWNDLLAIFKWKMDDSNQLTLQPVKETPEDVNFYGIDIAKLDCWLYMVKPTRTGKENYYFNWASSHAGARFPKEGDFWYKISYFDQGRLLTSEVGSAYIESEAVFMKKVIDDLEDFMPELKIANPNPAKSNEPEYTTEWLLIQQEAIKMFFNPRRNPDAKREEIVEWIKEAAKSRNLEASENIATAIFTVIKPGNHNPRKKRG